MGRPARYLPEFRREAVELPLRPSSRTDTMRVRSACANIVSISVAASVRATSFAGATEARDSTEPPETTAAVASPTCASAAESTLPLTATESARAATQRVGP